MARRVTLVGREARLDCMAERLLQSSQPPELYTISELHNPGLVEKSVDLRIGRTDDLDVVVAYAREIRPDFAMIGPEDPLAAGVVDALTRRQQPEGGERRLSPQ